MPDPKCKTPRAPKKNAHRSGRTGASKAVLDTTQLAQGIVLLYVDDVLTKNERHRMIRIGRRAAMRESDLALRFKEAVTAAANAVRPSEQDGVGEALIHEGSWRLEVFATWPSKRALEGCVNAANGDSDAPLTMVRDALQHAGVVDDDMRIRQDATQADYVKGERWLVARLTRLEPDKVKSDESIKHLLLAGIKARRAEAWAAKS